MNLEEKVTSIRLFPKLLLSFLLVLAPLYVIGVQINMSGSKNVKQEIEDSLSSRADLYMEIRTGRVADYGSGAAVRSLGRLQDREGGRDDFRIPA